MHPILQGIILGLVIVLPGMSGGTVFIILGIYEKIIGDLSRLNLKPHLLLFCGTVVGIFLSGISFSFLFANYRDIASAFLLGLLLASIKAVLSSRPSSLSTGRLTIMAGGFLLAFVLGDEPMGLVAEGRDVNLGVLAIGGAFSSATMLIPGIPGSSILIILGIYDDMLFYLREIAIVQLFVFGVGSILGILFLAKVLDRLYTRYQAPTAYFFAGLIAGSARVLLPSAWSIPVVVLFVAGFLLVWLWGGERT